MRSDRLKASFELPRLLKKIRQENSEAKEEGELSEAMEPKTTLQEFIDEYAVSLPVLMRAFPEGNLDARALEGHVWHRLNKYFAYAEASIILAKSENEVKFVQTALKMMEDWFYEGKWTECMHPPTRKEVEQLVKERTSAKPKHRVVAPDLIKRIKSQGRENLALSGLRDRVLPMRDFFSIAQTSDDKLKAYKSYAGNLFLGPAAIANTLSFVRLARPEHVRVDFVKLKAIVDGTSKYATQKFQEWGENVPKEPQYRQGRTLVENAHSLLNSYNWTNRGDFYRDSLSSFQRFMLFIKNVMIAAESLRRLEGGKLTKEGYYMLLQDMNQRQTNWDEEQRKNRLPTNDYPLFSFSKDPHFISASNLRANSKAYPFCLFAADYMRNKHEGK